jgi:hypothetical protein
MLLHLWGTICALPVAVPTGTVRRKPWGHFSLLLISY